MNNSLLFSLIVTSQGNRISDVKRLLDSLVQQNIDSFELIFVDQSEGDECKMLVSSYNTRIGMGVHLIKTPKVSLSKARNIGIEIASGRYIAFPDDDCWYSSTVLSEVKEAFDETGADSICCGAYDPDKNRYLSSRIPPKSRKRINVLNALALPISIGIFAIRDSNISFDEELGVGAKWGAGEESDLVLRLLNENKLIEYFKDIHVFHPYHDDAEEASCKKAYSYGLGYGALIKKTIRRSQYLIVFDLVITLFRSIGGVVVYSFKRDDRKNLYMHRIKGILYGLRNA